MTCFSTKLHMPRNDVSLVINVRPNLRVDFANCHCLSLLLANIFVKKSSIILEDLFTTRNFRILLVISCVIFGASIFLSSQVRTAAILVYL
jgi:hypothetical protein